MILLDSLRTCLILICCPNPFFSYLDQLKESLLKFLMQAFDLQRPNDIIVQCSPILLLLVFSAGTFKVSSSRKNRPKYKNIYAYILGLWVISCHTYVIEIAHRIKGWSRSCRHCFNGLSSPLDPSSFKSFITIIQQFFFPFFWHKFLWLYVDKQRLDYSGY